jgi:hypothetical protein
MERRLTCTCGYVLRARDDEELYALIRGHVSGTTPDRHRPAADLVVRKVLSERQAVPQAGWSGVPV